MIAGVSAVVVAALVFSVLHLRRDNEWAHGGDDVRVTVDTEVASQSTFAATIERLGAPADRSTMRVTAGQVVVVRVSWTGASGTGSFQVVALDNRVTPPRLLPADGGWASDGETGSNWAGAYEVLADKYDWLADAATPARDTAAVGAPATAAGSVTAWFRPTSENALPFQDADRDIVVALIKVDDSGDVRWARQISGQRPTTSNR